METNKPTVVISGSFRRHFEGITALIKEFESLGIEVLSPKASKIVNPGAEFVILESEDTTDVRTIEQRHLDAIAAADALYLYDPEGYLGRSATLELGWAHALGKKIFCKEIVADAALQFFCGTVATPEEIAEMLRK